MHSIRQIVFGPSACIVAAQVSGALERHGVQLTTVLTRSSIQQRDALFTNACDVAVTAMDNAISWSRDCKTAFRVVAQIERSTRTFVFSRTKFPDLASLRGARLAVDAPDSGFVLVLRRAVEMAGVPPNDYQLVPIGGVKERLEALAADRADAAVLGPPFDATAESLGLKRIADLEKLFPDYPGLGLIVKLAHGEQLRPALSAYFSALQEAVTWMGLHEAEMTHALVSAGFTSTAARDVTERRPLTLRPTVAGIQSILDLRVRYDERMDARAGTAAVVDEHLLTA